MMQSNELFTDRDREEIYAFFQTRDRWRDIVRWRTLEHGPVDTVFYGDSIFELWPTAEAFPELSHLNRGIGGDNINGLYFRLDEDIFPNSPRQVVINIGINGIERDFNDSIARLKFVAELMREHGIRVWCNSIAPLRAPDAWDRFQYQEKIVALNEVCRELFERELPDFSTFMRCFGIPADSLPPNMPSRTGLTGLLPLIRQRRNCCGRSFCRKGRENSNDVV